jgi:hypothetical protein
MELQSPSIKYVVVLASLLSCSCLPVWAQSLMTVRHAVHQDESAPLRELIKQAPPARLAKREAEPVRRIPLPPGLTPVAEDSVLQRTVVAGTPTVAKSFEGLGQGQYGFTVESAPPDTNGAVGTTQYVQWVNQSFAIFDKATGAILAGPTLGNTLWTGFGGGCAINNDGDPIVLLTRPLGAGYSASSLFPRPARRPSCNASLSQPPPTRPAATTAIASSTTTLTIIQRWESGLTPITKLSTCLNRPA